MALVPTEFLKLSSTDVVYKVVSQRSGSRSGDLGIAEPSAVHDGIHLGVSDRQECQAKLERSRRKVSEHRQPTQRERVGRLGAIAVLNWRVDSGHPRLRCDELPQSFGDDGVVDAAR
jgi:hypothetical protein